MNLLEAKEGKEYIVKEIVADDDELIFPGMLQRRADYSSFPFERRMRCIHKRWAL